MSALLAISWEPELRGILIVIIAVATLCGSVYLVLGTNLGARLGFLVAFAALAGWMFIMGTVWWSYGKGLLGESPSWQPVAAKTVLQDTRSLSEVGLIDGRIDVADDADPTQVAAVVDQRFVDEGWDKQDPSRPSYQQAGAAAGELLEEAEAFAAGEFQVVNVFDRGGERSPAFFGGSIDFLAFRHAPHYSVVEVAPLVVQREEPGRAPARPVIDTARPHQYVYMIRDLGNMRQPAGLITIGSLLVFLVLCYLLHSRDRTVTAHREQRALPAVAASTSGG